MANSLSNISKGPGAEMDPTIYETSVIERTNYLIVIGIDEYENKSAFPDLGGTCKKDCAEIIRILETKYNFQTVKYLKDKEAKLESIIDTFKGFSVDKEKNTADSNLIIYYSGHGTSLETTEDITVACIAPQGCTNSTDKDELYVINSRLFGSDGFYTELKVQHFLFIYDACYSGSAVKYSNFFQPWIEKEKGISAENQRSCWAFCSSQSDEKSGILKPKDNSVFTKGLLEILENNMDSELLIGEVKSQLEKYFFQNKELPQTPICERVGLLKKNTGQFVLRWDGQKAKKQRLLAHTLKSLNYTKQRNKLSEFENGKTHFFTIISGPSEGGLKFLNKMVVCSSSLFPGKGQPYIPVEVAYSASTGDEQVIELFNLALSTQLFEPRKLREYLRTRLKAGALSIEFKFRKRQWPNLDKKTLMGNTAKFVQSIHAEGEELNPIFIFIIDPDATNYDEFADDPFFKSSAKLIMPSIDLVDKTILVTWYDSVTNEEFDQLFKKTIVTDIAPLLAKSQILPGELIRQICTASGCNDLAVQLLDD